MPRKGSGWIEGRSVGNSRISFCRNCGKRAATKPLPICSEPKHQAYYRSNRVHRERWYQNLTPEQRIDFQRRTQYTFRYGLSTENFQTLWEKQGKKCAICGTPFQLEYGKYGVDHDHKTGKVRGILCMRCNIALGFYETVGWKEKAERYLAT
jgi:hypothetical protein